MRRLILVLLAFCWVPLTAEADDAVPSVLLKPARVFDGVTPKPHEGWVIHVRGERIIHAGPAADVQAEGARVIDLPDATLLPGLIEAHSHLFLHPYNEASWDDQVLKESLVS
jgi:imidazolonepropionase-like amidohydrolase